MKSTILFLTVVLSCAMVGTGWGYVGPGAGLSLLGALWGLVLAVGAALGFVVLWPLRRMIRRRRENGKVNPAESAKPASRG